MPLKPMKLSERIAAEMSVSGTPLNGCGTPSSFTSFVLLIPANRIRARVNPTDAPNAFAIDRPKPYPASILAIHTPSTAQFVVISGRNTPSEL